MKQALIFAGTTEGRRLAQALAQAGIPASVCVATEYGETLLPVGEGITHLAGRMDASQMKALMASGDFFCAADATHPYAKDVSANIRGAAEASGLPYLRLLRDEEDTAGSAVTVDSVREAVEYLSHKEGRILAATGSKELSEYTALEHYRERVIARVLSTEESVSKSRALGFEGRNLICMQGPFSEEMNYAILKQYGISWLVTKESGKAGGFAEKLRAARRAGASVILVGRPEKEKGLSFSETLKEICALCKKPLPERRAFVSLVSMGPGAASQLTAEARKAFSSCDAIIGAGRMVDALKDFGKPSFTAYKEQDILKIILEHGEYSRFAAAFSGDLGFYSGAKKLLPLLKENGIETLCVPGVSSLVYLADRLGISWDDAKLMSVHGRRENLIRAVYENKKVFTLLGGSVSEMAEELLRFGLSHVRVTLGENLSYENERILSGTPDELLSMETAPLAAALIENPEGGGLAAPCGLRDEAFIRGKVPMTKSEVRAVSLSRLELKRDSVVWDVGAGTGSVSVEAALQAVRGQVFAVEKNPEALALIEKNRERFGVPNLTIVEGWAPEALEALPAPTHLFIGGSSGNLKEIVRTALGKNPRVRVVLNAIALETVAEAMEVIRTFPVTDTQVSQVTAARGRRLGEHQLMTGLNPVYIISFSGGNEDGES